MFRNRTVPAAMGIAAITIVFVNWAIRKAVEIAGDDTLREAARTLVAIVKANV
jgi:hypothetical protein